MKEIVISDIFAAYCRKQLGIIKWQLNEQSTYNCNEHFYVNYTQAKK